LLANETSLRHIDAYSQILFAAEAIVLWRAQKMATALHSGPVAGQAIRPSAFARPAYQAFMILYAGFIALPIIAGADKFFDLLTNWDSYLAPIVTRTLGMEAHTFMLIVGAIEIVAGLLAAIRPQIGAYVVGLWLLGIIGNLLMLGSAYDVALRDFGLSLGAFALARLSAEFNPRPLGI
jgi:hypothetical protein